VLVVDGYDAQISLAEVIPNVDMSANRFLQAKS